jgi:hypothetical protein
MSQTFGLQPSAAGMAARADVERTTQHRINVAAKLHSILDRRSALKYELSENKVERDSLPIRVFPCCIVVRTSGQKFSMGVGFNARVSGEEPGCGGG